MQYINCYEHCGISWTDEWDCTCNDRCPVCNAEIEPYASFDIDQMEPELEETDNVQSR